MSPPRVKKARRSSVAACGHPVLTGQLIVCRRGRWLCLDCALAAIRARRCPACGVPASRCQPISTEGDTTMSMPPEIKQALDPIWTYQNFR
jgi:hypothetical protein